MKESVLKQIENRQVELLESGEISGDSFDVGKLVVMSDVSGSMSGDPMNVSIGLGILISEICNEAFRDLVLTFSEKPEFHSLKGIDGFVNKVSSMSHAGWGMNTNFEAAMNKIANVIETNNLTQKDIPDILCISDMQFDQACNTYNSSDYYDQSTNPASKYTALNNIKKLFHDLGVKMYGTPFNAPNIIFWNVRATTGFPAKSNDEGVVLMSGYSPSLLKFILSGEMADEVKEDGSVNKITPADMLQKVLSESKFDIIRNELDVLIK